MEYLDFVVQLRSAAQGRFWVAVTGSPAGDATGSLSAVEIPRNWSRESSDSLLAGLASNSSVGSRPLEPEEMGTQLFAALFPRPVWNLYERSLEIAESAQAGLRLKIFLDPGDSGARLLQGLPWELLFRDQTGDFLSLSRKTPIVRSLAVARRPRSFERTSRVRILAAHSKPHNEPEIDLAEELRALRAASDQGAVEVISWTARLTSLRRMLEREGPFDAFHFLGHGAFLDDGGEGYLVFEDEKGSADFVRPLELCQKLNDFPRLGLVVLNACQTSRNDERRDGRPFGGIAAALVRAGLPAVIAMQERIQDDASIAFSRELYAALARRLPLEAAVTEGRQAVHSLDRSGFGWAVPNLFLRASPARQEGGAAPPTEPTSDEQVASILPAFFAGDFAAARRRFQEVLTSSPSSDRARLFEALSRMAAEPSLSLRATLEIDAALTSCLASGDRETADTARLALAILRLDVVQPQAIRVPGPATATLLQALQGARSDRDRAIGKALRASRPTRILLGLERP